MRSWDLYSACAAVEGFDNEEHDRESLRSAWQFLLDQRADRFLQGWYGRRMRDLIEIGEIRP